jgi:hypothetical protein
VARGRAPTRQAARRLRLRLRHHATNSDDARRR